MINDKKNIIVIIDPRGVIDLEDKQLIARHKVYADQLKVQSSLSDLIIITSNRNSVLNYKKVLEISDNFMIYAINSSSFNLIQFIKYALSVLKNYNSHRMVLVAGNPWESFAISEFVRKFLRNSPKIQIQIHGDIFNPGWSRLSVRNRIKRLTALLTLPLADNIRVNTQIQAQEIEGKFPKLIGRVMVAPVPFLISSQSILSDNRTIRPRVLGYIGRLHPERGVNDFLTLVKGLEIVENDVKLMIVGSGELEEFLNFELKKLYPECRFRFVGQLNSNEMEEIWNEIGVAVFTPKTESYGRAMREAIVFGVPVMTTKTTGAIELSKIVSQRSIRLIQPKERNSILDFESLMGQNIETWEKYAVYKANELGSARLASSWLELLTDNSIQKEGK